MIYLDNGATSFRKPLCVSDAVRKAMFTCANPGRGGYSVAMEADRIVYQCRERAGKMFACSPEQVVFTANCTHGLNIAIRSLIKPKDRVVISGFEHNAVTRTLYAIGAEIVVVGRKLFSWEDTLSELKKALESGVKAAVFTHVSNVFGYILPIEQMVKMCKEYGVCCIIDAAQSAGTLPLKLQTLGADFIAMPGHKGLLGPQGTGLLLCGKLPKPFLFGGTGSNSRNRSMPDFLPDMLEAGTINVPGIAGLSAAIEYLEKTGIEKIANRERVEAVRCGEFLTEMGLKTFVGDHQCGTVSFVSPEDCEELAQKLGQKGIAVRAGLHCAPLAHESAGTLACGTVRISFGHDAAKWQSFALKKALSEVLTK